jgi:hypothetical protein
MKHSLLILAALALSIASGWGGTEVVEPGSIAPGPLDPSPWEPGLDPVKPRL